MKRILALLLMLTLTLPVGAEVYLPQHTPYIRNQENAANCWAHAAISLAETLALKSGCFTAPFSVDHLVTNTKTGGGNPTLFWDYALTRKGLLYADYTPSGLRVLSYASQNNADLQWLKTQIKSFGAVTVQVKMGDTQTLYNPTPVLPDHQLLLIGFDDDYPAEKFTPAAPRKGAFLAQNSYGGDGLLWISYADATLLTMAEAATSLVDDPETRTPPRSWQTYAVNAERLVAETTLSLNEGEELRSVTLPQIAAKTTVTLAVGTERVAWYQKDEGGHTVYFNPQKGNVSLSLTMTQPEKRLFYPADSEKQGVCLADGRELAYGEVALLYGIAPADAPRERVLIGGVTPMQVPYEGRTVSGYQMLGKKLIRLREWADIHGHGVAWDESDSAVTLTDTPTPLPPVTETFQAATVSHSRLGAGIPTPLYFIGGYQYLVIE